MAARAIAVDVAAAAKKAGELLELGKALSTAGACRLWLGEHREAEETLAEAIELLESENDAKGPLAEACLLMLRCCFLGQRPEEALRFGHQALAAAAETANADLHSRTLNGLGLVYGFMAAYAKALEYLVDSVRIRAERDLAPLGGPLNNMGNIFLLQEEPARALDAFERALAAFQREGNKQDEVIALGNIGRAFEALGQLDRAKRSHEAAVRLANDHGVAAYEAPAMVKLGKLLLSLGEIDAALEVLQEARRLDDERAGAFRAETFLGLADAHLACGEHELAELEARRAMQVACDTNDRALRSDAHRILWRIFEDAERWQDALDQHKRFHELRMEHHRELFSSRTTALQLQHEVERAQRERILLRAKNEELTGAYGELRDLHEALQEQAVELEKLTFEDPLTKLHNRRSLEKRLLEERARIERYGGTFSLLVCDIDDFKNINDRFSHSMGDRVLERVGRVLRATTRDVDVAARFGGEEFVVMLPATALDQAIAAAEKIRSAIAMDAWSELRAGLRVTVSIGVAEGHARDSFDSVFSAADAQLYHAKEAGKDRVRAARTRASIG